MARLRLCRAAVVAATLWTATGLWHAGTPNVLAGAQAAETASPVPPALQGVWRWVSATNGGNRLSVATPDRYTLAFPEAGRIALKADCNRAAGGVTFGDDGALKIGPMAMTRAMCPPGSLSDRFAQDVERSTRWSIDGGALLLSQPGGAGTLRFLRER